MSDQPIESESKNQTAASTVDRVSVGRLESNKLQVWINQMQEASLGFLQVSKSDLVNFLIREHKEELLQREIAQLRSCNYDPIKHIQWITQELKTAYSKNNLSMVAMLQNEIKSVEFSDINPSKSETNKTPVERKNKTRKRRANKNSESEKLSIADSDLNSESTTFT